jgi:hypothetical protein
MEERAVADHLLLLHEGHAALAQHMVEVLDGLEVAIDQRFVDERPQILGRLQLGTVGRLEHGLCGNKIFARQSSGPLAMTWSPQSRYSSGCTSQT